MQVIIVGGGKTGAHLASRLTDDGIAVTVIEQRAEVVERVRQICPNVSVIEGSGSDPEVLERAGVRIVKHEEGSDPSAVVFDALSSAKAKGTDVVLVDTAGRLHVKANLMEELKKISRVVSREYPQANVYKLLVLDATTGNNAVNQARMFDEAVDLDGIVLTKLDSTAKGGFVISLCGELEIPVVFVGTGEKIGDLEKFNPEEFIDSIL